MIFYLVILPLFVAENFNFETPNKLYSKINVKKILAVINATYEKKA